MVLGLAVHATPQGDFRIDKGNFTQAKKPTLRYLMLRKNLISSVLSLSVERPSFMLTSLNEFHELCIFHKTLEKNLFEV